MPLEGALQVLLPEAGRSRMVAGLPAALRTAHQAARELSCARIIFCDPDADFNGLWRRQLERLSLPLACANGEPAARLLAAEKPLLVVSSGGFPRELALKKFLKEAGTGEEGRAWLSDGEIVAVYLPRAGAMMSGVATAGAVARRALSAALASRRVDRGWQPARDRDSVLEAENSLYGALASPTDGYLARWDRRLSIALSKRLLKTSVTPNQITTAGFLLGLMGAAGLATGLYAWQTAGAFLLWISCILDGCDGEIARLKLLASPWGGAYDLAADHLCHLATFAAIPWGLHRADPSFGFLAPGALLVSGLILCMASVWWLILRLPENRRRPLPEAIERLASRDYVYVVLLLAVMGRLEWFLWTAGAGSHLFWLALWGLALAAPAAQGKGSSEIS
ncbi:MAG: CDP-alcohol phosphatidyltransferase family protein [Elusimicrobia bacterium]|nr:CDP-alcohol phosphatidyltransferase family protein [Elusimicrobiota bacterium]